MIFSILKKLSSLCISVIVLLCILPTHVLAQLNAHDLSDNWSDAAIEKCNKYGIMKGYDGYFRPNDPITRAEFVTMVNRAFNFTEVMDTYFFTDVPTSAWYANEIKIAVSQGYMSGIAKGLAAPNDNITREQAFTILSRVCKLSGDAKKMTKFNDDTQISDWAKDSIAIMTKAGYIKGSDGMLNPKSNMTRGETAQILSIIIGEIADHDLDGGTFENLTVRNSGILVKNAVINGNLYVTEGVGTGDVTIQTVTVKGHTLITGGGSDSIHINDSNLNAVKVDSRYNTHVYFSKNTKLVNVDINSSSSITQGDRSIFYDKDTGKITFRGAIDKIVLEAGSAVSIYIGSVVYGIPSVRIADNSFTPVFALDEGVIVNEIIANDSVNIIGLGKIKKMEVHSKGVAIEKNVNIDLKNISTDKDITLSIADEKYTGTGEKSIPVDTAQSQPGVSSDQNSSSKDSDSSNGELNSSGSQPGIYKVIYDGNGHTGGNSPIDNSSYSSNQRVTPPGNTGNLLKSGYLFDGWNTKTDGTGQQYNPGQSFLIQSTVTLYARWKLVKSALSAAAAINPGSLQVGDEINVVFHVNGVHGSDSLGIGEYNANKVKVEALSDGSDKLTVEAVALSDAKITVAVKGVSAGTAKLTLTVTPFNYIKYTNSNPMEVEVTLVVNKIPLILQVGQPIVPLSPVDKRISFEGEIRGLLSDEVTTQIEVTTCPGLSAAIYSGPYNAAAKTKKFTVDLIYDGVTTFVSPDINVTAMIGGYNTNYSYEAETQNKNVTINVFDGGAASNRSIPVTKNNIKEFNSYANTTEGLKKHYKLTENIELEEVNAESSNWTPIGDVVNSIDTPFKGTFDGNHHSISNLTIHMDSKNYVGLFGMVDEAVAVKNLALIGGIVSGKASVGSVVGSNKGLVENCSSSVSVKGVNETGGVAGENGGNVKNSYTTAKVEATKYQVGGVVGTNNSTGTVESCYSTGIVIGEKNSGGIAGYNSGIIRNCAALGSSATVTTTDSNINNIVGRVTGGSRGTLFNNYASSNMRIGKNSNAAVVSPNTTNTTHIHGEDISLEEIKEADTWKTKIGFTLDGNPWIWNEEIKMPILYDQTSSPSAANLSIVEGLMPETDIYLEDVSSFKDKE